MKLKAFIDTPPWEWPEDADRIILKALRDNEADESVHLLAAELAGDSTVINDELVGELLAIISNDKVKSKVKEVVWLSCRRLIVMVLHNQSTRWIASAT